MKLVAHTLVKNENRWIWFAITSVLDVVDEIMVWDTGSTDNTAAVIKTISSPKLKFRQITAPSAISLTQARQDMLDQTRADWLLILDGDEIWTPPALNSSLAAIGSNSRLKFLVSSYRVLLGDVFHYQEEKAGKYRIGPHSGHVTIRFINLGLLSPLRYERDYPHESLRTADGHPLQHLTNAHTTFISDPYLHATHTRRTSLSDPNVIARSHIFKHEWGLSFPDNFAYPKSFFYPRPSVVPSPWIRRGPAFALNAAWQTPLKLLKRRI